MLVALLIVALGPAGLWGVAQAQGPKTLTIAIGADATGLDPQTSTAANSGFVMATIFDGLVNHKPASSTIAPGLAETWSISSDGKVYTFKIRHGVTFHDGTPVNAHTVGADIDRAINPQNPCYVLTRPGVATRDAFTFGSAKAGNVVTMDIVDDYTLRFTLVQPNAPFLTDLAMVAHGIMSPAATKQYDCDASQHPVGTGPFKFAEWARNDHVTLDANPAYWGGRPKVDRIVFRIVPESTSQILMLERNEVQILSDVLPSDYSRITRNNQLKLLRQPGLTVLGVGMSNDWGPFQDKRVRQAMNYAVDKDTINKGLYAGAATASQGIPPTLWGYNKSVTPYPYDVAKAKQLLKEAGYANGISTEILIYPGPRAYNPAGGPRLAEAVQPYLANVGVKVKITQLELGAYFNAMHAGLWQGFALTGWFGDNGDPDNFLGDLFEWDATNNKHRIDNWARHHNPDYDKLIREGRMATDQARRAQIYIEANRILHDDAPWIFINYVDQARAIRANVEGYMLAPLQVYFHMELVSLR
jgi:peptide/nickel transport system substrate-binding protein